MIRFNLINDLSGSGAVKRVLVTGGTVFVSRYIAEYYVKMGWNVYVLNRNSREQPHGVNLIEAALQKSLGRRKIQGSAC